jgi:hypothetical protein
MFDVKLSVILALDLILDFIMLVVLNGVPWEACDLNFMREKKLRFCWEGCVGLWWDGRAFHGQALQNVSDFAISLAFSLELLFTRCFSIHRVTIFAFVRNFVWEIINLLFFEIRVLDWWGLAANDRLAFG